MDIILLIVLVVVAILLFLAELFIVPGISIAGILSGCCIIYANYHAFSVFGTTIGCIVYRCISLVHAKQNVGQPLFEREHHIYREAFGQRIHTSGRYRYFHYPIGLNWLCRLCRTHHRSEVDGRVH